MLGLESRKLSRETVLGTKASALAAGTTQSLLPSRLWPLLLLAFSKYRVEDGSSQLLSLQVFLV